MTIERRLRSRAGTFVGRLRKMIFGIQTSSQSILSLFQDRIDYRKEIRDLTDSDVVMAPIHWIMRTFPEAPLAMREWEVDPDTGEMKSDNVMEHAFLDLLDNPNPFYPTETLWSSTVLSYAIDGNAYWMKVYGNGGMPVQLWWVPHTMMSPLLPGELDSDGGGDDVFINYYRYSVPGVGEYFVSPEDVIHFRFGQDIDNPRKGLSPLKSALREVYTDQEAADWTAMLLRNGAVPGLTISPDGMTPGSYVEENDLRASKKYMEEQYSGRGRGKPHVSTIPIKIEQFGFSPEQMSLKELRRLPEERISALLGIPAIVAGLGAGLDRSTFANMSEAREMAYESNIIPTQRIFATTLTRQLLERDFNKNKPTRGRRSDPDKERMGKGKKEEQNLEIFFDISGVRVLQEDENTKVERLSKGVNSGWIRVAEARREQSLPTNEWDEVYLRPQGIGEIVADEERPDPLEMMMEMEKLGGGGDNKQPDKKNDNNEKDAQQQKLEKDKDEVEGNKVASELERFKSFWEIVHDDEKGEEFTLKVLAAFAEERKRWDNEKAAKEFIETDFGTQNPEVKGSQNGRSNSDGILGHETGQDDQEAEGNGPPSGTHKDSTDEEQVLHDEGFREEVGRGVHESDGDEGINESKSGEEVSEQSDRQVGLLDKRATNSVDIIGGRQASGAQSGNIGGEGLDVGRGRLEGSEGEVRGGEGEQDALGDDEGNTHSGGVDDGKAYDDALIDGDRNADGHDSGDDGGRALSGGHDQNDARVERKQSDGVLTGDVLAGRVRSEGERSVDESESQSERGVVDDEREQSGPSEQDDEGRDSGSGTGTGRESGDQHDDSDSGSDRSAVDADAKRADGSGPSRSGGRSGLRSESGGSGGVVDDKGPDEGTDDEHGEGKPTEHPDAGEAEGSVGEVKGSGTGALRIDESSDDERHITGDTPDDGGGGDDNAGRDSGDESEDTGSERAGIHSGQASGDHEGSHVGSHVGDDAPHDKSEDPRTGDESTENANIRDGEQSDIQVLQGNVNDERKREDADETPEDQTVQHRDIPRTGQGESGNQDDRPDRTVRGEKGESVPSGEELARVDGLSESGRGQEESVGDDNAAVLGLGAEEDGGGELQRAGSDPDSDNEGELDAGVHDSEKRIQPEHNVERVAESTNGHGEKNARSSGGDVDGSEQEGSSEAIVREPSGDEETLKQTGDGVVALGEGDGAGETGESDEGSGGVDASITGRDTSRSEASDGSRDRDGGEGASDSGDVVRNESPSRSDNGQAGEDRTSTQPENIREVNDARNEYAHEDGAERREEDDVQERPGGWNSATGDDRMVGSSQERVIQERVIQELSSDHSGSDGEKGESVQGGNNESELVDDRTDDNQKGRGGGCEYGRHEHDIGGDINDDDNGDRRSGSVRVDTSTHDNEHGDMEHEQPDGERKQRDDDSGDSDGGEEGGGDDPEDQDPDGDGGGTPDNDNSGGGAGHSDQRGPDDNQEGDGDRVSTTVGPTTASTTDVSDVSVPVLPNATDIDDDSQLVGTEQHGLHSGGRDSDLRLGHIGQGNGDGDELGHGDDPLTKQASEKKSPYDSGEIMFGLLDALGIQYKQRTREADQLINNLRTALPALAGVLDRELEDKFAELGTLSRSVFLRNSNLILTSDDEGNLTFAPDKLGDAVDQLRLTDWKKDELEPLLENHTTRVTQNTLDNVGTVMNIAINVPDPVMRQLIEDGGKRIGLIDIEGDTRKAIFRSLHEGRALGEGAQPLARRIREEVPAGRFSKAGPKYRSMLIARTETKWAQNESSLRAYGAHEDITHVIAYDAQLGADRSDPDCIARNGQTFTLQRARAELGKEHPNGTLSFAPVIRPGARRGGREDAVTSDATRTGETPRIDDLARPWTGPPSGVDPRYYTPEQIREAERLYPRRLRTSYRTRPISGGDARKRVASIHEPIDPTLGMLSKEIGSVRQRLVDIRDRAFLNRLHKFDETPLPNELFERIWFEYLDEMLVTKRRYYSLAQQRKYIEETRDDLIFKALEHTEGGRDARWSIRKGKKRNPVSGAIETVDPTDLDALIVEDGMNMFNRLVRQWPRGDIDVEFMPAPVGRAGQVSIGNNRSVIFYDGYQNRFWYEEWETIVHEMGHALSAADQEILQESVDFMFSRTKGDRLQSMRRLTGQPYGADELTRPNEFFNPYVGLEYSIPLRTYQRLERRYGDKFAYANDFVVSPYNPNEMLIGEEIVSMGLEFMTRSPYHFSKLDPEHFDFILERIMYRDRIDIENASYRLIKEAVE